MKEHGSEVELDLSFARVRFDWHRTLVFAIQYICATEYKARSGGQVAKRIWSDGHRRNCVVRVV
jgi:hypothetical protein